MKTVSISIITALIALQFSTGCNRVSDAAKETVNKAGDLAGQTAGEFSKGVEKGVQKTQEVGVQLSPALQGSIKTGQCVIQSDSLGNEHKLSAYLIFEKDFKGDLLAKAYTNKELEMGRSTATIKGKKGDAQYVEFVFDKRVDLDVDSKITIE